MAFTNKDFDLVTIAGDIGGTNTNLALVGVKDKRFDILFERHYRTREEASLVEPFGRFVDQARQALPGLEADNCCISGAGPVVNERIELTNAPWGIDGPSLAAAFGLPVHVINDFMAISYGVVLLDPKKPEQLTTLAHTDGSRPQPTEGIKLIVGAGTGLGVGYVAHHGDRAEAYASEGGHITLPVYDEESRIFQRWLSMRCDFVPGAEAGVSGMGISNLFNFFAERAEGELGERARLVLDAPESEKPALVASGADFDPLCEKAMDAFVKLYARVAADLAAAFIPKGGVYLAGGVAAKNEVRFLEGSRFMNMFEKSYREHIRLILKSLPVMIVKDYNISLYGAANAAVLLS